ncbi:MAG: ion transporter [marine benthic group bacterium]|nr:ion transporter [Gemmatimonadota bacterium]
MTDQTVQPGEPSRLHGWRAKVHEVIFEADTPAGKAFDILLIVTILFSVVIVSLESVPEIRAQYGPQLRAAEWVITILFTIEYLLRLLCVERPSVYATSFFGIVDLLAILPTYISVLIPGAQALTVVRVLRLLRIFRVLKLVQYVSEARTLSAAMRASSKKIFVFLFAVVIIVVIVGSLMYLVEGPANGFDSIPRSIYWAVVTLTTVGYGDIAPGTSLGRFIAVCVMILGYGIIAVPTGIVTRELVREDRGRFTTRVCRSCNAEGHDSDAGYCRACGSSL